MEIKKVSTESVRRMPDWLEIQVPVTKAEILSVVGNPCKTYEQGCYVCDAWKSYNDHGFIMVLLDRAEVIRREGEPVIFEEYE
jgi:hypothetical protein